MISNLVLRTNSLFNYFKSNTEICKLFKKWLIDLINLTLFNIKFSQSKCADWAIACTPASVLPDPDPQGGSSHSEGVAAIMGGAVVYGAEVGPRDFVRYNRD